MDGIKEKTVNKTHRRRGGKPQKSGFTSIKEEELMTQNDTEGGKKRNKILPVNSHSKISQHQHVSLTICACTDSCQNAFTIIARNWH